jgi:hypothetical protein
MDRSMHVYMQLMVYQGQDPLGRGQFLLFEPGPYSTCMIISSQPPSAVVATAGASISSGLAATITLQHCISTTAASTAQLIAAIVAAAIGLCLIKLCVLGLVAERSVMIARWV